MSFSQINLHCVTDDTSNPEVNIKEEAETKMKTRDMKSKNRQYWKVAAVAMMLAAWVSIPFLTGKVKADGETPTVVRRASLVSPTGSVNPHGEASWQLCQSGNRELEIEVEDINLAAGTSLTANINGNAIGQMVVDVTRKAKLRLRTEDGQTVPAVLDGSTIDVRNGTTVLVNGVFSTGGPTPSPSVTPTGTPTGTPSPSPTPSGTPDPGELFASLTGPTLNGVLPGGYAEFESHSSGVELEIRVRQVNLPIGTSLTVLIDGSSVGSILLGNGGEGRLKLSSENGQVVPAIITGSTIAIRNGSSTVLAGTFASSIGSTPSPTPTGTPGPTPSPSPASGRSFEAHLTGSQVTPPVTTPANGDIKMILNATETQATVFGEFDNLSSAQTGARIETTVGTIVTIRDLGTVGGRNGRFLPVTFNITVAEVQQLRTGLLSAVITSVNNPAGEIRGKLLQHSSDSDFDGDGNQDFAVFRPTTGAWWTANSSGYAVQTLGGVNDRVVSGDFDGDGKTDAAVYKDDAGQGVWEVRRSSDGGLTTTSFGLSTDVPVRGDFDGDGRLDIAVFRPSNGVWYIQKSDNTGYSYVSFGLAEDKPMPADMDGDGKDDIVVFRPSTGVWYWIRSSDSQISAVKWGMAGDIPVRGDFDGDGKADLTVYRPSTGVWYTLRSSDGGFQAMAWGLPTDIPVAGNYDADGKTDIAVFRPSDGNWYILRSTDGTFQVFNFGLSGDVPLIAQ